MNAKPKQLIDSLKGICASYGLGNDGNEFKIITQVFLYKFLNDKFAFEIKKLDATIAKADKWEQAIAALSDDDLEMLQLQLGPIPRGLSPTILSITCLNNKTRRILPSCLTIP